MAAGLRVRGPGWKAFAYFAMFCSIPVYYMLWAGQIHVLVVLAVALILAGLMRLDRDCPSENGACGTVPLRQTPSFAGFKPGFCSPC